MKRRMEISQHCWKFIYKHSDISIFAVCHRFYFSNFFYLYRSGKNIFTNKSSSSGIYQYFNSSVRRVNMENIPKTRRPLVPYCSPECIGYAELEQASNKLGNT